MIDISRWQSEGYVVHFLWLPSPELAIDRVALRVRSGGHGILESVIRRRYHRGLTNFHEVYRHIVDRWVVHHAASDSGGDPIAEKESGLVKVRNPSHWAQFETIG